MSLPSMLEPLKAVWKRKARYKVIYGGRASGKSFGAALHLINMTSEIKLKVLCIRQFQNNIKESVYTLLKDIIYDLELQEEFEILSHIIRHKITGSEFVFYGIARNFMEIKSFEGADICYIEEAHALTHEQFSVIDPTIRKENSEIYIVFNPQNRSDYIFQEFVEHEKKNSIVLNLNYPANPYLSNTMKNIIDEAKREDLEEYEHIYLGVPREGDDNALFSYDEIEKAMDNSLEAMKDVDMTGVFTYAADIGRFGKDHSVITKRKGFRIYDLKEKKGCNTMEIANLINSMYLTESRPPNAIFVDTIGIGAGVKDKLDEIGRRSIEANVSMRADSEDLYYNKRAECYFLLRDFVRKGGKLPDDPALKEELLAIRYIYNNTNGKILIQPKDEIKKILGRSPDKSDSVSLHFFSRINTANNNSFTNQPGGEWR